MKGAQVGYTGGHTKNPSYEDVCRHDTGHAEAIEVEFDPSVVSYEDLLKAFFAMHDPTTLNRQGPNVGDQYRSAIFYLTPEQKKAAEAFKTGLKLNKPVVTEITSATTFWRAEEYHQRYHEKHGGACAR